MKVIFMGTPDFAVPALRALAESDPHSVCLVVTQPDRPQGRSSRPVASAVKRCALEYGIPVFQPERIRQREAVERIAQENADVIVVAAFGQILPKEMLELPRLGCINIHGSLLPKYRGAAPIQWAVINGEKEAGNTIMQMNEGLDTGDILMQEKVILDPEETAGTLYEKLSQSGGRLLLRALEEMEKGTVTPIPQKEEEATYAGMLRKEMGRIDWKRSAAVIGNQVRGMNPWPSACTGWKGKLLKIWMAAPVTEEEYAALGCGMAERRAFADAEPGTVMIASKDLLAIQTGDGLLSVKELQLEGKKRMPVTEFLRGVRMQAGDLLETIGPGAAGTGVPHKV